VCQHVWVKRREKERERERGGRENNSVRQGDGARKLILLE